jgi:hypothetical protein
MDETTTKLLEAIEALGAELRTEVAVGMAKISKRCDALDEKLAKKSNDGDDMAEQVAADRRADSTSDIRVANSLLNGLARDMTALKKQVSRPMADLNAFADTQAKCDAVFVANGARAEPPMAGEDIIAYNIRMHRKLQPYSAKWKGVDLTLIAADRQALENVLTEIRADAMQAGLNPVGLPEFQHRAIVQESPGGHRITSFVGNGTIFKQLSRPVRHVAYIGTRTGTHG